MNETYPDRTSKVPYYTFTEENAEAQWPELAENPLLQRMNACRESLASDRYWGPFIVSGQILVPPTM